MANNNSTIFEDLERSMMDGIYTSSHDGEIWLKFQLGEVLISEVTAPVTKDAPLKLADGCQLGSEGKLRIRGRLKAENGLLVSLDETFHILDIAPLTRPLYESGYDLVERLLLFETNLWQAGIESEQYLTVELVSGDEGFRRKGKRSAGGKEKQGWFRRLLSSFVMNQAHQALAHAGEEQPERPLIPANTSVSQRPRRLTLEEDEARLGVALPEVVHPLEGNAVWISGLGDGEYHSPGARLSDWHGLTEVDGIVSFRDWKQKHGLADSLGRFFVSKTGQTILADEALVFASYSGDLETCLLWHFSGTWLVARNDDAELRELRNLLNGAALTDFEAILSPMDFVQEVSQDGDLLFAIAGNKLHRINDVPVIIIDSNAEQSGLKVRLAFDLESAGIHCEWFDATKGFMSR